MQLKMRVIAVVIAAGVVLSAASAWTMWGYVQSRRTSRGCQTCVSGFLESALMPLRRRGTLKERLLTLWDRKPRPRGLAELVRRISKWLLTAAAVVVAVVFNGVAVRLEIEHIPPLWVAAATHCTKLDLIFAGSVVGLVVVFVACTQHYRLCCHVVGIRSLGPQLLLAVAALSALAVP